MKFSFDVDDAQQYGINEAIFLENMKFWIAHNQANEKNFYDVDSERYPKLSGQKRYFTFNSNKAFSELFPFWSEKQVRTIIDSLESQNVIITGNYNETKYDRTKWYGFYENIVFKKGKCIRPNGQMELPEGANRSDQKGGPIPDSKTDNTILHSISSKVIVSAADRPVTANAAAHTPLSTEEKYNILAVKDKDSIHSFIKENCPCFITPYVDYWNIFASARQLPQVLVTNTTRKRKFSARIKDKEFNFLRILYKANQGDFIMKGSGKWFTFDWILANDTNYLKVIEGNYENRETPKPNESTIDKQRIERQKAEQRTAELANQR